MPIVSYPQELDDQKYDNDPKVRAIKDLYQLLNVVGLDESNVSMKGMTGFKDLPIAKNRQDNTTNSTVDNQFIQYGWGFILGDNTDKIEEAVTFPVAYDSAPVVVMNWTAAKTSSDPVDITELTGAIGNTSCASGTAVSITTTGFQANLNRSDSVIWNNPTRYGYTWIAIGTKSR